MSALEWMVRQDEQLGDLRALLNVVVGLARLGHLDVRGRASVRLASGAIAMTPRPGPGVPPPTELTPADLMTLDGEGHVLEGQWDRPLDAIADLELYRVRPGARAIVQAQPELAMSFAAAGRPLAPLTHTEAALVLPTMPVFGCGELVDSPQAARSLATTMGERPVALLPGSGSLAIGESPAEAGMLTHQLELLARVNYVVATTPADGSSAMTVSATDSARISAQKAPPADFQDFFDELSAPRVGIEPPDVTDGSEPGLRDRVVAACRLLFQHGLVEHLEHVSVRLPGADAFLITPRKHLGHLRPAEIAVVGMDGLWRAGNLAPPPFLWLHRDIFAARPDVAAIVHTHQTMARALLVAGANLPPVDRAGASWLARPAAVYHVPDLMFDAHHRQRALAQLGDANILHEASHGTDFLASTVEAGTVAAILYERQARIWHRATQLGQPASLPVEVLDNLDLQEPGFMEWWRHLLADDRSAGTP